MYIYIMEAKKETRGRKEKDPKEKIVPVTTYVKAKNRIKAKKLIDQVTEGL